MDLNLIRQRLADRKTGRQRKALEPTMTDLSPLIASVPLLRDIPLSGFEDDITKRLMVAKHLLHKQGFATLSPLLPLLLSLKGRPYSLDDHFPFEPFFRTRIAKRTLLKTGRQVSKSTSLAAQGVIFSNCIPFFSTLYVTPLFEMIRRFSQNYVRPFIETSPVRKLLTGPNAVNSVLQRSFSNRSQMIFSFAFLDAERTRGISADKNVVDEVQNMDISFLPIIHETMSGSPDWGVIQYAGTPLTMDNTIQKLWNDTSMAEWVIRCRTGGCNHDNIPSLDHDLIDMIGPWHPEISEKCPGVVCAKCRKPINPRWGRWEHRWEAKRWTFAGYHVPQIIMPMHYAVPEKWETLLGKQAGRGNTPIHVFYNEVCGESYDSGSKLITETDLRRAATLPWPRKVDEAKKHIGEYAYRVCAVDWGGGGVPKGGGGKAKGDRPGEVYNSYTSIAVLGLTGTGKIHVLYGLRSVHPHEHIFEAKLILSIMRQFKCSHLVHDYTGAGRVHETVIFQAGLPYKRIIPVRYTGPLQGPMFQHRIPTKQLPRDHFRCDRSGSLLYTCQLIKSCIIRFFQYDYVDNEDRGLLADFLALIEQKGDGRAGPDPYAILRDPNNPDDFAHAVNIGTMFLCYASSNWPDVAEWEHLRFSGRDVAETSPQMMTEWEDL